MSDKGSQEVSLSWIHPDLRRQIIDENNKACLTADSELCVREHYLKERCTYLSNRKSELQEQHRRLKALLDQQEKKISEISAESDKTASLLEDTKRQRNWMWECRARHRLLNITTADVLSGLNLFHRLSSPECSQTDFPLAPSSLAVDVHFFHLFLTPSLWGNTCFLSHENNLFQENRKENQPQNTDSVNETVLPQWKEDDASKNALLSPREMARIFLDQFFPILSLKDAYNEKGAYFLSVNEPSFIQQPCPLEFCAKNTQSSSLTCDFTSPSSSGNPEGCFHDACLYWHENQLDHLINTYAKRLLEMRLSYCVQDPCLCTVSKYMSQSLVHLRSCSSVADACAILLSVANQIIRLGWYIPMMRYKSLIRNTAGRNPLDTERKMKEGKKFSFLRSTPPPLSCFYGRGWVAPICRSSSSSSVSSWCLSRISGRTVSHSKSPEVRSLENQLRDPHEMEIWYTVMNHFDSADQLGSQDEKREPEDKDSQPRSERVLQLLLFILKEKLSAISWRCVIRMLGDSCEKMRWLSELGKKLFPSSPHLRLQYVVSLILSDTITSSSVSETGQATFRGKVVADACLEAGAWLTQQCEASMCTSENEEDEKAAGAIYRSITSRYISYMIAITTKHLVHLSYDSSNDLERENSEETDSAMKILEQARSLLRNITSTPGKFFILPIAFQNLLLLRVLLEECVSQDIEKLDTALHTLPLGSISDQTFVLCVHSARNRRIRLDLLHQHLQLLHKGKPTLHSVIKDELRSPVQLSMLRSVWNPSFHLIEHLIRKATITGEATCTALWMEYIHFIDRKEVNDRSTALTLLQSLESPVLVDAAGEQHKKKKKEKSLQVLSLVLKWRLEDRFYDVKGEEHPKESTLDASLLGKLEQHSSLMPERSSPSEMDDMSSTHHEESSTTGSLPDGSFQSPLEMVASLIMNAAEKKHSELKRILYLQGLISDSRFCHDANCVWLLLMALLRRCCFSTVPLSTRKGWFEASLTCAIAALHEQHLMWWSSIDSFFHEVIGLSHYVILLVYHLVPALLGADSAHTEEWRQVVLEVGLAQCGMLHPSLREK